MRQEILTDRDVVQEFFGPIGVAVPLFLRVMSNRATSRQYRFEVPQLCGTERPMSRALPGFQAGEGLRTRSSDLLGTLPAHANLPGHQAAFYRAQRAINLTARYPETAYEDLADPASLKWKGNL